MKRATIALMSGICALIAGCSANSSHTSASPSAGHTNTRTATIPTSTSESAVQLMSGLDACIQLQASKDLQTAASAADEGSASDAQYLIAPLSDLSSEVASPLADYLTYIVGDLQRVAAGDGEEDITQDVQYVSVFCRKHNYPDPLTNASATTPSSDIGTQVKDWISQNRLDIESVVADAAFVRKALDQNSPTLTTACSTLEVTAAVAHSDLPAPDAEFSADLRTAISDYNRVATSCIFQDTSTMRTNLDKGDAAEHAAEARLKKIGGGHL